MTQENPFNAPTVDQSAAYEGVPGLENYTSDQLKKLYYRSCNVSGMAGIILIGTALIGFMLASGMPGIQSDGNFTLVIWAILAFNLLTVIGLIMRTQWGRILGIITSVLMLIRIPIGTIIGIMGLFAFLKAKELFGPNRIKHRDLKLAFNGLKNKGKESKRKRHG